LGRDRRDDFEDSFCSTAPLRHFARWDRRGNDHYLSSPAHFALHGHQSRGYRSGHLPSDDNRVLAHPALLPSIATPDALAPTDRSFLRGCDYPLRCPLLERTRRSMERTRAGPVASVTVARVQ
jgi:hypothetical protein